MRCPGICRDIEVASGINDDIAHDSLHTVLGLADDALDRVILNDSRENQLCVRSLTRLSRRSCHRQRALEAVGIEGCRKANRVRH